MDAFLEHVNYTVTNPEKTAGWMCELFDWHVRWSGDAIHGGRSLHVGNDTCYVVLFSGSAGKPLADAGVSYERIGGFNHLGIVVDDLDAMEERVRKLGFKPHSHADYEPGRRFYFNDADNIEYEIVSYA